MPPRAFAVTLPIASAAWLASFLAGCADAGNAAESPPASAAAATSSGKIGLRYVTHRVQSNSDYKRISEYFTGEENTGGDIVVRTDKTDRRGLYFIAATDYFEGFPDGAVATLEFISTEKTEPQKHLFVLPAQPRSGVFKEIKLGVTGKDWPASNPKIVAWKLTLREKSDGAPIAAAQSFLWSLPERQTR